MQRRQILLAFTAAIAPAGKAGTSGATETVAALERSVGGRIGLAALDTGTGDEIRYRADERFAMCSTFKLMLAAAILSRVDSGSVRLEQPISYSRSEVLPNSPVEQAHLTGGALSVAALLQSVLEVSDNTAANLLLGLLGGPAGYTACLRSIGDTVTRLDRREPDLNSNLAGDPRDTTTPAAMVMNMQKVLVGPTLSRNSRGRLLGWMRDSATGRDRLRAHIPTGWSAGDKTGTGAHGAVNDLAIFRPPTSRPPILVACYMSGSERSTPALSAVHASIGLAIANALN
jgi:beta-lactamase class A